MIVPPNITTPNRQGLLYTTSNTLAYSGSESGSNLDRGVLNPSPCEYHIYTDINSLACETFREVQPNNGNLILAFRSDNGWVHVKLHDVVHVPLLSCNLISLPSLALKGHTYEGDKDGVTLKLKEGKTVHFPLIAKLCRQY